MTYCWRFLKESASACAYCSSWNTSSENSASLQRAIHRNRCANVVFRPINSCGKRCSHARPDLRGCSPKRYLRRRRLRCPTRRASVELLALQDFLRRRCRRHLVSMRHHHPLHRQYCGPKDLCRLRHRPPLALKQAGFRPQWQPQRHCPRDQNHLVRRWFVRGRSHRGRPAYRNFVHSARATGEHRSPHPELLL